MNPSTSRASWRSLPSGRDGGGRIRLRRTSGNNGPVRRLSATSIATLVAVAGAALFVFVQLQPRLLFASTTPNGGDMGAHVWGPAFMRDHLLPHWRITGWAPDWYAGFAFPTFYFPLPSLLIIVLDLLLPYEVAFKLVTVAGLVSLPVSAWAFGKLANLRAPGPACLAVATLPFLFDRTFTIYGGNIASTLAGEFSYSISLSLALLFLGVLARMLDTGRHRALAGVLLALTLMSHVVPTFFAVVGALVLMALQPSIRRLGNTVIVGVLGGLLTAFWALPFIVRLPFTNDMAYEKEVKYWKSLFPHNLRWLVWLAVVGALVSLVRRCRVGTFLTIMAGLSAVAFRFAPQGKIWNPRLLPFWFLCLSLLVGIAAASVGWLVMHVTKPVWERAGGIGGIGQEWSGEQHEDGPARRRWPDVVFPPIYEHAAAAVTLLALVVGLLFVALPLHLPLVERLPLVPETTDRSYVPDWAKWNYNGYERKVSYPEYREVVDTMARVGRSVGCGRAHWEYEPELDQLGTPLALMLLPYWTHGCIGSMEGLYFESSATTPYHFLSASELSRKASRPQRGLSYKDYDLAEGVRHLQMLGSRYYMAFTPESKAAAAQNANLKLVASTKEFPVNYPTGPGKRSWEIYEVAGSALVQPLANVPVVVRDVGKEKDWLDTSEAWFLDPTRTGTYLAAGGPPEWKRVERTAAASAPAEAVPVQAKVSQVRVGDDRITFDVDTPGTPILVKISYFPNWQASGAKGPWRISPNLMVVIPTERHVELHYGLTSVDVAGMSLTAAGLLALILVARLPSRPEPARPRRARRRRSVVPVAEGEAEPGQPPYRTNGTPEDGRARRARLADRYGQLGHREAGPLGPQDQLGVEQVGAEAAPLDHGHQRLAPHDLHPVRVRDSETETAAEDEGED